MSNKVIGFTLNEQIVNKKELKEQGVFNGFGNKIVSLPPIIQNNRLLIGFSAKDLGKLFVEIGTKLQSVNDDINIIRIETILRDNITDTGKQLFFEMTYKELCDE